ncbi:MAG: hypothetical protein ABIW38_05930, partial [Ferruginibacter sp.]
MNYIRHLNAFFTHVKNDMNLTSSHVSLYMALFQYWNFNRFQNPFPVYRDNLMQLSKIGSKNTYHKCIKELHEAKYIYYHPSPSKFLPVKISIGRLDIQEEPATRYEQLDLFNANPPSLVGEGSGVRCLKIDTGNVPNMTATSTEFDTSTVPNMGHNIKHKHFNKRESKTRTQKIFDKNEKTIQAVNDLARVPNPVHTINVTLSEVEGFFLHQNYPATEAKKFFNHYKAIGWKIKGITPITDWKAAAEKWMLNAGKYEPVKQEQSPAQETDLGSLYKQFLAGQNIFQQITLKHFSELKLEVTDEIMQHAWLQRINQLTGSNQYSVLQLLQAYQDNKENDGLLLKDRDNLISLAKRITVLKHFQQKHQIQNDQ